MCGRVVDVWYLLLLTRGACCLWRLVTPHSGLGREDDITP